MRGGAEFNGSVDEDTERPPAITEESETGQRKRVLREKRILPFGIARNRLLYAAQTLRVPVRIVETLKEAHIFVTTKQYYRKRPKVVTDAERRGIPLYVLRANTSTQIETFLTDIFELSKGDIDPLSRAMGEAAEAINTVLQGEPSVSLAPQESFIRKYQHEMARKANLRSESFGNEPNRSVRIFRDA
jgi:hypothetical protein